ncbi:hypothetical protein B0H14DRAFT_3485471 [Mycena olivaceomarginata]|nr:hypothetical protein B0H14DRAFT_3485471 [Mycena olivaceomarginata]
MAQNFTATTIAPTSEQEMASLVSKVTAMSKLALDMTRLCIEINDKLPAVVQGQVVAALASVAPLGPVFHHSAAPLPDEIDDHVPRWLRRTSGLVRCMCGPPPRLVLPPTPTPMTKSVGFPSSPARRKTAFKRLSFTIGQQYRQGECERVSEAPPAFHVAAPAVPHQPRVLVRRAEYVLTLR